MQHARSSPLAGAVAGFFAQFALGTDQRGFAWIKLASGKLNHDGLNRVAVLALQHHPAIVKLGHDHHCAGMNGIFARCLTAVGQADGIALDVQKMAPEQLFRSQRRFDQMRRICWAFCIRARQKAHERCLNR